MLPTVAVLARNPNFAAPLVHPIKNLLSMQGAFNVLLLHPIRRTKNLQLVDGRHKTDRFLTALFLLQSTVKPMVKAAEKISLQISDLARPSFHPIERHGNRLQNAFPHFSDQKSVVIEWIL
ncbi:MAG: hypothetical protein WCA27_11335 [Candidatus Sulfotelmatobacter sp.]